MSSANSNNYFLSVLIILQEGRRGSEEVLPENFGVPLEGDRDVGAFFSVIVPDF